LYLLFGGADFGGGVWDLLAWGPRKREQRALIEDAIGPVWEVNHVWLIFVVVMLFSAFPRAFAAISIALHVPLTAFLLGIVARGSAFTFRAYDSRADARQRRWGLVFSWASIISPILLGMAVGALASGRIRVQGTTVRGGFFAPWVSPFCWAVGVLALSMVALLAAAYLAYEAPLGSPLQNDFRRRALASAGGVLFLAAVTFALAEDGAPQVRAGLTQRPWNMVLYGAAAVMAAGAMGTLWRRRFGWARVLTAAWVSTILLGWIAAQYPFLVVPDVTLQGAAAHRKTLTLLLWAVGLGSVLLAPSLYVLFRVFKGSRQMPPASHG
ncbi:MAG TPA: cytochrome d ubiquinol oxidase subunit II, partial [Myxococcaceae bacterium]|nr:cytochrome d ubiquinol oxidase subunit II [Myxococcaceae bacterium]